MPRKQEEYEDVKDASPEQTMKVADNRFKNQKQNKIWNVLSK